MVSLEDIADQVAGGSESPSPGMSLEDIAGQVAQPAQPMRPGDTTGELLLPMLQQQAAAAAPALAATNDARQGIETQLLQFLGQRRGQTATDMWNQYGAPAVQSLSRTAGSNHPAVPWNMALKGHPHVGAVWKGMQALRARR